MAGDKVQLLNVNKPGYTENLDVEKYDYMKEAMLTVLERAGEPLLFDTMLERAEEYLREANAPKSIYPDSGSNSLIWLAKTVQLDLEARGYIRRIDGAKKLTLQFVKRA